MATLLLASFLALLAIVGGTEFVQDVRQDYAENINTALVEQIKKELLASYIYQGYASYFQRADVSLQGIKKFFSAASLEERDHAQYLVDYINKRGGQAQFVTINLSEACTDVLAYSQANSKWLSLPGSNRLCICVFIANMTSTNIACEERTDWEDGLMAFEDALLIERYVNDELMKLHKKAVENKDAHLKHIIEHEFLEEQINSINKLALYVTRLRSFSVGNYKLGEYIFDQHLS